MRQFGKVFGKNLVNLASCKVANTNAALFISTCCGKVVNHLVD